MKKSKRDAVSTPDGRTEPITRDDLESGFRQLQGEVDETTEQAKTYVIAAAAAVGVLVIGLVFMAGRKRGRKKSTVVEIRRI